VLCSEFDASNQTHLTSTDSALILPEAR
jgi:hypothetical protein